MWIETSRKLPIEGEVVMTKIDEGGEQRNTANLIRNGNLWFFPDLSMYVYYTPTHWWEENVK